MSNKETANPTVEERIDTEWEATHLYDRYQVDTAILNNYKDICALTAKSEPFADPDRVSNWTPEHRTKIEELKKVFEARFDEIVSNTTDEKWHSYYVELGDDHAYIAVQREWEKHYFLPRAERLGLDQYNDFVASWAQYNGSFGKNINIYHSESDDIFTRNSDRFYRALAPIDMVDRYNDSNGTNFETRVMAPPGIEVNGKANSTVYSWDGIGRQGEWPAKYVILYPSTEKLLASMGINIDQNVDLDNLELGLQENH